MNACYLVLREQSSKLICLVTIAKRSHPFPFRTRKLSSSAPMVVGGCPPVRVGRCQAKRRSSRDAALFCILRAKLNRKVLKVEIKVWNKAIFKPEGCEEQGEQGDKRERTGRYDTSAEDSTRCRLRRDPPLFASRGKSTEDKF